MQPTDHLIVRFVLARGGEIYDAQKRFGADPSIMSRDSAYFNAVAMGLALIGGAAKKFSAEFRAEHKKVAWARIDGWQEAIFARYETLSALDVWAALEDMAELYGACYVVADSL
jgi:uncharacterized protein with HEPN domain